MKNKKTKKYQRRFRVPLANLICLLTFLLWFSHPVLAGISPKYLKNGRTYDQESEYFKWTGDVSYVRLFHRDNTSLPSSEGGTNCSSGCYENVTRIGDGASVSGNFTYLKTFNVQLAYSGDRGVGKAVIKACGQTIQTVNLYQAGAGAPGFNNIPSPSWSVPVSTDCTWSITATGGYVDLRAVTTSFRSTSAPTVDLKINGSQGPYLASPPGSYTLSWTSTNAASCVASSAWEGALATNGSQAFQNIPAGTYTYTLTCSNPAGSASDSVAVQILSNPQVSISVPEVLTAPASFSASWNSQNAETCSGGGRFNGLSGVGGSKEEMELPAGVYDYSMICTNAIGVSVTESKQTIVVAAPLVDVKVNGLDGPELALPGPASYSVSWTSANAVQCSGSGGLAGIKKTAGSLSEENIPVASVLSYTMTCQNAAGESVSDSVNVEVFASLSGNISAVYPNLLLYASKLGQPTQVLSGTVSGGSPPYWVDVWIRSPAGEISSYSRQNAEWVLSADNTGDPDFGTTREGVWTAWADLQDSSGQSFLTSSVTWEVAWYPVHARP